MGRRDSTIKRTGLDGGVIVFKRGLLQAKGEELRKPNLTVVFWFDILGMMKAIDVNPAPKRILCRETTAITSYNSVRRLEKERNNELDDRITKGN